MNIYTESTEKYGFVYLWRDKKRKMYYIGSHWGYEDDGYICSSRLMYAANKKRPEDFKRRILTRVYSNRKDLLAEEQRYLSMIDPNKIFSSNSTSSRRSALVRYYNLDLMTKNTWHSCPIKVKEIGKKISNQKKGRPLGPCSPEKAAAISAAKIAKRKPKPHIDSATLMYMFYLNKALPEVAEYFLTTKGHIRDFIKELGYEKVNDLKESHIPKEKMDRETQNKLSSMNLKKKWACPIWAANQRKRLCEGAKNRPSRIKNKAITT